MCGGGKNDDPPTSSANPVELDENVHRPTTSRTPKAAQRPQTKGGRPQTKGGRPETRSGRPGTKSGRPDTKSGRPPPTANKQRPPGTSEGGRRSAHGKRPSSRAGGERRSHFPHIQEDSTDSTIIRNFSALKTFINQHMFNYFPRNSSSGQGRREFDNPQTRQANIRQYLTRTIISNIIERNKDTLSTTREISSYLAGYSTGDDKQRENNLLEVCELGRRLGESIRNHPATWRFDFENTNGFITMSPALMRDGKEVEEKQLFKG